MEDYQSAVRLTHTLEDAGKVLWICIYVCVLARVIFFLLIVCVCVCVCVCVFPSQDVDASEIKVQVCIYAFDLLYLNGEVSAAPSALIGWRFPAS